MRWVRLEMAKKGRVARILTALHRVAGTPVSEALKRRQRSAVQRGDAGTHSGSVSKWRNMHDESWRSFYKELGNPTQCQFQLFRPASPAAREVGYDMEGHRATTTECEASGVPYFSMQALHLRTT